MSKTAVVTGGSRGIGKAISVKLAQEGYDIAINYASNDDGQRLHRKKSLRSESDARSTRLTHLTSPR